MTRADLEAIVTLVGRHGAGAVRSGAAADYFTRLRGAPQFVGNSTRLVCPECRYDMHEVRAHDLLIDFCLNCQALWFDEGELQQTVRRARERGEVDLIPQDIDGNDTASLICYMLEALGD